jgi:amino acid permease
MVKVEGFLFILSVGLTLFTFIDCAQRDETQLKKLPKWGWLLVIFLFGLFGSLSYLFIGRNGARAIAPRKPQKKILPPDDDPDFLNKI